MLTTVNFYLVSQGPFLARWNTWVPLLRCDNPPGIQATTFRRKNRRRGLGVGVGREKAVEVNLNAWYSRRPCMVLVCAYVCLQTLAGASKGIACFSYEILAGSGGREREAEESLMPGVLVEVLL